jgi:hypothetical protein
MGPNREIRRGDAYGLSLFRLSTLNSRLLAFNSTEQSENVYENKGAARKTGGIITYAA